MLLHQPMVAVQVQQAFLGTPEILMILAVVVIMFGATKLPQLGKGLGEAIGNFKKAQRDAEREKKFAEARDQQAALLAQAKAALAAEQDRALVRHGHGFDGMPEPVQHCLGILRCMHPASFRTLGRGERAKLQRVLGVAPALAIGDGRRLGSLPRPG